MGGGPSTTTTPVIPDELKQLYGLQTEFAKQQMPAISQLTTDVMQGKDLSTNPFVAGLYATAQQGGDRAAAQTRQNTPRGAAQDYAVSQIYRDVGMKRGQIDAEQRKQVLQQLYSILGGYNPSAQIGQKQQKPAWQVDVGIGPFQYTGSS